MIEQIIGLWHKCVLIQQYLFVLFVLSVSNELKFIDIKDWDFFIWKYLVFSVCLDSQGSVSFSHTTPTN